MSDIHAQRGSLPLLAYLHTTVSILGLPCAGQKSIRRSSNLENINYELS